MLRVRSTSMSIQHKAALAASCAIVLVSSIPIARSQTRAGTLVSNTANVQFEIDGARQEVGSNSAQVRVAEILDLRLSTHLPHLTIIPHQQTALPFILTNAGNGSEAFALGATFPDGTTEGFAVDTDGDGVFDPARDTLLGPDARTPRLAPGHSLALFALVRPASSSISSLKLSASAVTGSGRHGTLIVAGGDEGTNAIVGATGAFATLDFTLAPGGEAEATLDKTQRVTAPNGGASPVRGAVVTYSLVARFTTGGIAAGATVSDPIPMGTAYVPGSISLNGTAMTDAADADAGTFDGSAIHVALGDVPSPAVRTVQFKVVIK
jgi:uncharacterized repeat protein (TIGR01451 family)